jgi:hypothetical protein
MNKNTLQFDGTDGQRSKIVLALDEAEAKVLQAAMKRLLSTDT